MSNGAGFNRTIDTVSDEFGNYRIEPFSDADSGAPSRTLTELHAMLLGHSPVVRLGPEFMERFYYRVLPELKLICGAVAYIDDQPAGFVVATHDSDGFMRTALIRRWWLLAWILGISLLRHPGRLTVLWETLQIMSTRNTVSRPGNVGELLSFGVLPEFRSAKFVRRTGARIGQDLMQLVVAKLRVRGVRVICSLVDKDNLPVKLMYRGLGWKLTAVDVPGWRIPQVEFTLHEDSCVPDCDDNDAAVTDAAPPRAQR